MEDRAKRFVNNPILHPQQVRPSIEGLVVEGVLNPGAFTFRDNICLLLRVAERPMQHENSISTVVIDSAHPGNLRILEFSKDDPYLVYNDADPRGFYYKGKSYLTTLSHLRLAVSRDGIHFEVAPSPLLVGRGPLESFGIEDCRITEIDGRFYLTYTAVSPDGYGVGLTSTADWQDFSAPSMMLAPSNKDCALFPERIGDSYAALHRPTITTGKNNIWMCRSPDLLHWGQHTCLARVRPGMWDSARIGAGASPIRTSAGWLAMYHGADADNRYCLGALLLDLQDPTKVLARSQQPLMEPLMDYEKNGFFGNVVFVNGHIVDGDTLILYYGASDTVICGATLSISDILASLQETSISDESNGALFID